MAAYRRVMKKPKIIQRVQKRVTAHVVEPIETQVVTKVISGILFLFALVMVIFYHPKAA